jgi:hypothetical protein
MSKLTGTINGIFNYHDQEILRVKCEDGTEVYVDRDMRQVIVKDDRELQTIKVVIDGELKSPWSF